MVVIKISEVPSSQEALKERVQRAWKINPQRLKNEEDLIAVHRGKVVAAYKIKGYYKDEKEVGRVAFDLEETSNELVGKQIDYPTSYPSTVTDISKLKYV